MPSKLSKWGNSLGVRLPQYIAERTGLTSGDYLYITLRDNGEIVIKPVKAKEFFIQHSSSDVDVKATAIALDTKW
ncbi:MAG: AbrB/MazE/SpoVT family DNA-binding domain-containing protein [bacterium]|nr:AbrB/MazE/SpoVT family DNA-binding domain-containing protein [bacterium]